MKNKTFYYLFPEIFPYLTIALIITGLIACRGQQPKDRELLPQKKSIPAKPPSSNSDTLRIDEACALFFLPDSIQFEKLRLANEERIFASMEHDCTFQMRNAMNVLHQSWPKLSIRETSGARYLAFIHHNQSTTVIDLNLNNDMCGIYLFDPEKTPMLVDMMNIDTELNFYFKK